MKNRILIVSDNHGIDNISDLKEKENCKYAFHAGDSQFFYNSKEMVSFDFKVKGNCDYDTAYPEDIDTEVDQIGKVFITHGHQKRVKYSLHELSRYCKKKNINLCIYGHTHVLNVQYENDLLIINPGSTTYSRSEYTQTYLILNYDESTYEIEIKDVENNQKIKKVKYFRK